jgi:nicotinic acetylcholine receptor
MAMSALSVVFSVLVLNIHHKGSLARGPPMWLKTIASVIARILCMKIQYHPELYAQLTHSAPKHSNIESQDSESLISSDVHKKNEKVELNVNGMNREVLNQAITAPYTRSSGVEEEISRYFNVMFTAHSRTVFDRKTSNEWQEIARVMDKLFFVLFICVTSSTTFILLVISPMTKDIALEH